MPAFPEYSPSPKKGEVYDNAVAHAGCWAPNDKTKFFRKEVQTDGFGTVTMGEFECVQLARRN